MRSLGSRGANFLHSCFGSQEGPRMQKRGRAVALAILAVCATAARADDEIQVYNGEMAEEGQWTAQHHLNYAFQGRTQPDFPGGLVPNHTLNGTPEFAYGVAPWF